MAEKKYQVREVGDKHWLTVQVWENGDWRRVEGVGKVLFDRKEYAQRKARKLNAEHAIYMDRF